MTRTYQVTAPPPPPVQPPPPAPLPRIVVTLSSGFEPIGATTTLNLLTVRDVPRGSTVTATCKRKNGRSCGIRRFVKRNARGDVKLKRFLRKKLRPGTVIEVRVTKRGSIGAVKQLKTRRRKRPTITTRCLPPGAKKPVRC